MEHAYLNAPILALLISGILMTTNAQDDGLDDIRLSLKNLSKQLTHFQLEMNDYKESIGSFITDWTGDVEDLKQGIADLKEIATNCGCPSAQQAQDCSDLYLSGNTMSGRYTFTLPDTETTFQAYCDMDTDGGGWTVFQRRGDFGNPEDHFNRDWDDYKSGFGDVTEEFWLGNDVISTLTNNSPQELIVDMWDTDDNQMSAKYSSFSVDTEDRQYRLQVGGFDKNNSDAGDSLTSLSGQNFTTYDHNTNSVVQTNCAAKCQAGWWFLGCGSSDLNGLNLKGTNDDACGGIKWSTWKGRKYSLPRSEMKIRSAYFGDGGYGK